jgi:hypothetical protein
MSVISILSFVNPNARLSPEMTEGAQAFEDFAAEHWGTSSGCRDLQVTRQASNATFEFWTAISPIIRYVGVKLHEKYPTLSFQLSGCDEFASQPNELWTVLATEPVDPEFAEKERLLINRFRQLIAILIYGGGMETFDREIAKACGEIFAPEERDRAQECIERTGRFQAMAMESY